MAVCIVEIRQGILNKNDQLAAGLRRVVVMLEEGRHGVDNAYEPVVSETGNTAPSN